MSSSSSSTTYTHDKFGRVTGSAQTTEATPYSFAYTYTLSDQLTSMTYPSGRTVTYGLDSADRITGINGLVAGSPSTYASGISFTAPGTLSTLTPGHGITETYSWNDRLQPISMSAGNLLTLKLYPCDVWCRQFAYDMPGNRTVASRSPAGSYAWDVGSISAATNRIVDAGWNYDSAGDVTQAGSNGSLTTTQRMRWRCSRAGVGLRRTHMMD